MILKPKIWKSGKYVKYSWFLDNTEISTSDVVYNIKNKTPMEFDFNCENIELIGKDQLIKNLERHFYKKEKRPMQPKTSNQIRLETLILGEPIKREITEVKHLRVSDRIHRVMVDQKNCLKCSKLFHSTGKFNKLCDTCVERNNRIDSSMSC